MENLVVLGGGESGVGAAILGKVKGMKVFLSDMGTLKDEYRETLVRENIEFEEGKHSEKSRHTPLCPDGEENHG